jgi:Zn-dependent peptidase ImmA (M78 family)
MQRRRPNLPHDGVHMRLAKRRIRPDSAVGAFLTRAMRRSQGRDEYLAEGGFTVGYRVGAGQRWNNPSVLAFARGRDPIEAILEKTREVTTRAMDEGWVGPPFDPLQLAEVLKIRVVPAGDVADARVSVSGADAFVIELNPMRPRVRQRFSIAHEIAHTFFDDCPEHVRNRMAHAESTSNDWELEALCNIAAAEMLMPLGSMPTDLKFGDMRQTLDLRRQFEVSVEAIALRTIQLASAPIAMFSASRIESGQNEGRYKIDYAIESRSWNDDTIAPGFILPSDSIVRFCTAVGHTQVGEATFGMEGGRLECVGIGGYPGATYPRVIGYLYRPGDDFTSHSIEYLVGDAVEPNADGVRIVAFMTNDATPNWGGGFAKQVAIRHSEVQVAYRNLVAEHRASLVLGSVHLLKVSDTLYYAPIVAQQGFGKSSEPRIRYTALEEALMKLGIRAAEMEASVHMPRIGAGGAGGSWDIIREMIQEHVSCLVPLYVYDLPARGKRTA